LGFSLSEALAELHRCGLVHRDIKPSNIIFVKGRPKLADIGLVAQAGEKRRLGTEGYIPPEGPGKPQADLYSLGKVLYEASTGTDRLDYPDLPPDIDTMVEREAFLKLNSIILKACDNDIRKRYQTATEISQDLTRLGGGTPVRTVRRNFLHNPVVAFSAVLLGALALAFPFYWLRNPTASSTPEKSVAVLPFENLSNDREDASFADGVQDDILTKLAKIADLKVISRTSVMQYRGERDIRQIGDALRVSHVLEGSVRKTGAWLHINAQLIDTRTDTHVWAEQYDRDLKDVFAIQSEIAQKVAERLQAKISAAERLALEQSPTVDLTAFDLYSRAKNLLLAVVSFTGTRKTNLLKAADLLNQAVAHDPTFFQAYCQLAWTHDYIYFDGWDRTPARLGLAEAAIQAAFRLRPDAGEAHLANAWNLYLGYRDYDGALAELEKARPNLPNDARLFELKGYIERRRGRWEESTRDLERAVDLDPRNFLILQQTALSYDDLRRYADEEAILDRALALQPNDAQTKATRAYVELDWKADTRPVHKLIDEFRVKDPAAIQSVVDNWLYCALAERDPAAAAAALTALGENSVGNETIKYSPRFMEGLIARMAKDDPKARAAFTAARAEQEKLIGARPDDPGALSVLGLIDAALGRKEEALREGRRAVELLPVEKDAVNGTRMIVCLARIAAWAGDNDLACEQLARASHLPGGVTYGELKLLPWWDPLRGDPRFEQIVASLAPK
jgi:TolB-like protein/Flp pilus assembly protein TadD